MDGMAWRAALRRLELLRNLSDGVRGAGVVQDPSQREEAEFF